MHCLSTYGIKDVYQGNNKLFPALIFLRVIYFPVALSRPELMAMVSELWSNPDVPVVVLSCVPEYNIPRLPCISIVEQLQLGKLNRPWQVSPDV